MGGRMFVFPAARRELPQSSATMDGTTRASLHNIRRCPRTCLTSPILVILFFWQSLGYCQLSCWEVGASCRVVGAVCPLWPSQVADLKQFRVGSLGCGSSAARLI